MRHARQDDLARLNDLLISLRTLNGLTEKKVGVFYRKSRAFLHFHEHEGDLYADLRLEGTEFDRYPCSTRQDQKALAQLINIHLTEPS